jgi:23S rRNA-/tRNA-specific pseudouridylate synthase
MTSQQSRSEYLIDCDRRSIEQGISLIFGDWDQDLIVINKPFGVPMGASHRDSIGARVKNVIQRDGIFPVHRLDKYTSGCLVIALKAEVARVLQFSLQNHTLASIKTTKSNLKQKVKHGQITETVNGVVQAAATKPKSVPTPAEKRSHDADTAWSKRYRVMVQLTPCVQRDLKEFMQDQHNEEAKNNPGLKPINFDGDVKDEYLDLYQKYFHNESKGENNSTNTLNTKKPGQLTTIPHPHLHSPDLIRSPHQQGTLYTPTYSAQHRHDTAPDQVVTTTPPPLLSHGFIHSHLTQRDFFPADWIHQHDVVHVDHINTVLENRLKDQRKGYLIGNSSNSGDQTFPPELSFTSSVGVVSLDDIRVPQGHAHGSALYIENPNTFQLEKVDLSSMNEIQNTENLINTTKNNPKLLQNIHSRLSQYNSNTLRNLRDAVEFRLLVPGAPRPPDNEDEEAEDQQLINKSTVFNATDLQEALSTFSKSDFKSLPLPQRKQLLYNFFSRLCGADGVAIAPFNWINAKIQLFEKVVKMHALGRINPRLIKTVFRNSGQTDLYAPDLSIASAGPTLVNTAGKVLFHDTTDTKNAFEHTRPDGVTPLDQNGDVVHVHTADVYFADKDLMWDKETIESRQHPLYWTSHRVLLKHNSVLDTHPLAAFNDWSKIGTDGSFLHHHHNNGQKTPLPPVLQPYELPCGCLLPYTTPLPRSQQNLASDVANPYSLLNTLPPSAPHPFIPTNYLYESVPAGTERNKFIPNRNMTSLPQNIPAAIMKEFGEKKLAAELSVQENEKIKKKIDEKILAAVNENDDSDGKHAQDILEMNKTVKTKMKQKQEINNARTVPYHFDQHNNHQTGQFGSLFSSKEFSHLDTESTAESAQPERNPAWDYNFRKRSQHTLTRIPSSAKSTRYTNTNKQSGSENILISVPNSEAKEATTLYRLYHLNVNKGIGIYNAKLLSGRTHQLRIHFADSGLPIRGDPYYNPYYIKHWANAALHAHYQKQQFNQYLRSIHLLPLFGHADSGVTAQMTSFDVWDSMITPNVLNTKHGGPILKQIDLFDSNCQTDHNISKQISPNDLLNITPYTPKSRLSESLTDCFDEGGMAANNVVQTNSTSIFGLPPPTFNKYSSLQTIPRNHNGSDDQPEEDIVIPPPGPGEEPISDDKLREYLSIYKAFADTEIDGEMFLQSYLIEFPLPTEIRPPRHLRQVSRSKTRAEQLQQKYLEDVLRREQNVEICDNSTENSPRTDSSEFKAVIAQTSRPPFAPKVTLVNPTLEDGLPLYHNRMGPDEVKAARQRRKDEKKLHKQRLDALNSLCDAMNETGVIRQDEQTGNYTAVEGDGNETEIADITFADIHTKMPTHDSMSTEFFSSPDNLDKYVTINIDGDDVQNDIKHPDGFYDIQPLFSNELNPIWETVRKVTQSDQMKQNYDPNRQLALPTLHPGPQFQDDKELTLQYAGKEIKTPISNLLHLSTEYKSWTYKTPHGTEMVRILLGIPDSWKYAM